MHTGSISVPYGIPEPARIIDKPLTIGELILQQLFVFPEKAGSLFTAQWSNENFFTDRLIHAVLFKNPLEAAVTLAAFMLLAALFLLLIRFFLRPDAGARLLNALTPLLCGVAGAVLLTHLVILGAYRNSIFRLDISITLMLVMRALQSRPKIPGFTAPLRSPR